MDTYLIFLIIFGILSLISFCLYGIDKSKAINGKWRIKESVLLLSSFVGGAVGGYLAMFLFHHKTRKWYFHFVNIIGLFWSIALVVYLFICK